MKPKYKVGYLALVEGIGYGTITGVMVTRGGFQYQIDGKHFCEEKDISSCYKEVKVGSKRLSTANRKSARMKKEQSTESLTQ